MFFGLRSYCFLICVLMVSSARAGFILNIDLSTVNQVTISATTELSAATVTNGNDGTGVYLQDFFTGSLPYFAINSSAGNSLVYFNSTSDGSPRISKGATEFGLNIYSMDNGTPNFPSFTNGVQAFKGSATWNLSATQYAAFQAAPLSGGDVYAFAYTVSQLNGGPKVIGQYSVSGISAVPEPTSIAIFGLGALGMGYLARRKRKV